MEEKNGSTGGRGAGPGPSADRAAVEKAASALIATLPRMLRNIKQQVRNTELDHSVRDLGDSQFWVLHALAVCPQLTTELARNFNVTNPTMTKIVDGLVERGYVRRRPDHEDRRRIYLELTETGMEIARFAHEQFRSTLTRFISPLSDAQLADITLACRHLSTLLPVDGYDLGALHKSPGLVIQTEDK
jgi:DNA-binding MarR family transcriptional regulator